MSRRLRVLLATVPMLAACLLPAGQAGAAPDPEPSGGRVLVVTLPDTTWATFLDLPGGAVRSFAGGAAVASLSVRTADRIDSRAAGYLSLGAGRRASAADPDRAGTATVGPDGVVRVAGFDRQVARNDEGRDGASVGALGDALASAGRVVAVVGDAGPPGSSGGRAVALATSDRRGETPTGRIDGLVRADAGAPGGAVLDADAVVAATVESLGRADLVLVELSDVERAVAAGADAPAVRRAAAATDQLVGRLVATTTSGDTVVLVSPTTPGTVRQLGVFALRAPDGTGGWARSGTTRRAGYVAIEDVAATVLGALGVPVPDSVGDTPVTVVDGPGAEARLREVRDASGIAVARDGAVGPVAVALLLLVVVTGLLGIAVVRRGAPSPTAVRWLACTTVGVPVVAFLTGWWPGPGTEALPATSVVLVGAAILGAAAVVVAPPQHAVLVPAATTVVVLLLDVVLGGRLQLDTPLGYSATVGGRYSGLGNQASAYLLASALVVLVVGWSAAAARGVSERTRVGAGVCLGAVVATVTAWPTLGSDVGGTVAVLAAFAVGLVLLVRPTLPPWRLGLVLVLAGTVAALVLGVVGWWDRSRPASDRTHLGRFAQGLVDGDAGRVLDRRWSAATDVLWSTPWTLVVPVVLVALALLAVRPQGRPWTVVARHPELAPLGASAAVAGGVGWLVNDSGVAVAACVAAIAVPTVVAVATAPADAGAAPDRPDGRPEPVAVP